MSDAHKSHAIVLGGSMAGLLACRVLAESYNRVTLIERDAPQSAACARKGVPQGRHIHALLIRGEKILADLFPGLIEQLLEMGAERVFSDEVAMYHFGHWVLRHRFDGQYSALLFSRPLLDWQLFRRVEALPNVGIASETDVTGLAMSSDGSQVAGVCIRDRTNGQQTVIHADLVVDATGRGSQLPKWLEHGGFAAPKETHVKVDVTYSTRLFARPTDVPNWRVLQILPTPPENKTMGAIFPIEGGRWMVTIAKWFGGDPPKTEETFLQAAKSLPVSDLYDAMKELKPIGPIVHHRLPSGRWRHYEHLRRMPDRLLVMGDSLVSFNPVYGQGMTVAAMQAVALRKAIRASISIKCAQKRLAAVARIPWEISTGEDKRYPETEASVSTALKLIHRYSKGLHVACASNPKVLRIAGEVNHMLRSPAAVFRPDIVFRVLLENWLAWRVRRRLPCQQTPARMT